MGGGIDTGNKIPFEFSPKNSPFFKILFIPFTKKSLEIPSQDCSILRYNSKHNTGRASKKDIFSYNTGRASILHRYSSTTILEEPVYQDDMSQLQYWKNQQKKQIIQSKLLYWKIQYATISTYDQIYSQVQNHNIPIPQYKIKLPLVELGTLQHSKLI